MNYYEIPYTAEWSNSTFVFYIIIIILGYIAPKIRGEITISVHKKKYSFQIALVLYEILLIFVKGLSVVGKDLVGGYYYNFSTATSFHNFADQSIEKGYILLNVLVHHISTEYSFFVMVVTIITLLPIFGLLHKYKNDIDASTVLIMYSSIYYFQSFSLVRIAMASSIALFSFDALYEQKKSKALFFIVLASLVHISALILIIPWLILIFNKKEVRIIISGISVIIALLIYLFPSFVTGFFTGRHSLYSADVASSIGFAQFTYSIPLMLALMIHRNETPGKINEFGIVYILLDFLIGIIGYRVSIFGRFYQEFVPIAFIMGFKHKSLRMSHKMNMWLFDLLMMAYCIIRFCIYISAYYNVDDIMPYINLFGWRF